MARRKEIKNLFGTLYEYEYDGDKLVSFKKADDKTGKNGISTGKSNAPKKEAPKSAVKKVDDKYSSLSKSLGERVYGETTKDVTLGKDFRQDIKRLDEQKTIEKAEKSISGYAKAKAWAFKMEYERTDGYSRLSSTIGDDIQKLMSDYNNAKNNKVDQTAYDELRERSKKIRDDLRNYYDYYSLYNTDDAQNAKTFGELEQLASGIHDDLHYSDDVNGFYNRKQSQGVQSYAELRQKRGLLQRKRGNDGYDTDRINAELEALDKYGYNQNVIDSMTDEDWEYEKQRLGEYAKNAKNEADKIKNTLTGNAPYIAPYLTSDKVNSGNTKEVADRLKSAEDKFYYYNNLLSEVEELERMTKIERTISEKWGNYSNAASLGGVLPLAPNTSGSVEYEAVNNSATYDGDSPVGKLQYNRDEVGIYSYMTDDEKNTYNYIFSQTPGKASEYLEDIRPILTKRKSQAESMDAYTFGQNHGVIGTAGSVLWNASAGLAGSIVNNVKNAFAAVNGNEIDPYDTRFQGNRNSQLVQQGVKDTIDSKVGKLIYSAGTQVAELALSMGVARGIGGAIGTMAKGANAAQIASKASNIANQVLLSSKSMLDTTLKYKESGESDLAAVGMGMLSGLIEAYTERKSLSNLLKSPDIFKDMATKVRVGKWASKIGVDALKEGLEEVEANALNTIAALVFDYRDNDSFLSAIDKAKAEGKSDSEALAEAIKAVAPEYVESFVVGALAGGAFGAVNTASSINTVNNVIDISSDYFGKNGTSRQSVERLLIDMGYSDEAEIAKAANAIVRKGNGRSVDKNTEALFEDDVRLRGMLYGYVEAVDAGARRDTVSELLDEVRETETPEPTATSVPKKTTVTKPEAELTEEEAEERKQGYALINDDNAGESFRTRGRSGSKVYTYAVNKGGLIDKLIKDGYSAEEARSKTEQLFRFMYNQGRINGNVDIAIKAASENIVSGYEAQAREFFVAGQMDAQGRLIGKTNARLVPNQTLKNMQRNGQINSLTARAINTLASKLGINIAFSDTMKGGALGSFNKKTGTLLISSKAKNKYFLTAVHESIHTIRTIHPESYNKMNEVVYDILKDNKAVHSKAWNKILSSYRKEATKDGKIDRDLINEELTAKIVSHLLTDESYIKELAETDRTTLQRIYDAIVDFFDKIFKRYSEDASPREAEFKDALKELQSEFNTIKAMYENALKETTNVQQSEMVLPSSGDGANVLNSNEYWKPDLSRSKLNILYKLIDKDANNSVKYVTDTAKWLYTNIDGTKVFAIYSVENISKPTLLYESKGKQGEFERDELLDLLEDNENGKSINGKSSFADRISKGDWLSDVGGMAYSQRSVGGTRGNSDVRVLPTPSKRKPSGAFVSVIKNLFEIEERTKRGNVKSTVKTADSDLSNDDILFSLSEPVEETKDLIAVHNLSPEKLLKTLKLGGLPMPSIAITRAREGYNNFGAISLVFGKETIDPKFFRSNKVYSGDAWTPTYPHIEYKVNEKATEKIREKMDGLVPRKTQNDLGGLHLDSYNVEEALNRSGDMVQSYRYNYAMKYAFLKDKGIGIELPTKDKPLYRYNEVSNDAVISFAHKMVDGLKTVNSLLEQHSSKLMEDTELIEGVASALNEDALFSVDKNSEMYQMLIENPLFKADDIDLSTVLGMLEAARKYFHTNGKIDIEVDYREARNLIDEKVDMAEYEKWLKDLFSNIIAKEGIRNNKDLFTPSGNRRSFEALHYEHTLENVIKAMKEEGIKGIGGFGDGNIFGAATTEYGSIDDIKSDAENRMQTLPESKYDEIKKGFSDRLFELANSLPIHKDSFSALDDAANMLIEAVSKFKTRSDMANYLRTESKGWANYSEHIVDDLIELVKDIRNMPVAYFEAKPQRAVGYDEIKAVIMPEQSSYEDDLFEVKSELEKLNVPIIEYEYGDDNSRLNALNSLEHIFFSKSETNTDDTSSENIDPGVQGTQAISDAAYFELKKEVRKKLDEHIKKYGAIKKGEDAVRDTQFPVQTSDDRYVRRFTRTAFEADSVTDEVAAEIAEEVANGSLWTTYSRITDKKSVDAALNRFKSVGYDKMLEEWEAKIASNERIEKGDIAKAMVLVQEAGKRGDMKTAMGLIAEIAAEGTRAGQLVQSLSLLKKLSGQANVYYIERTIKQIQKDIDDKYTGRKAKKHVTIKVPEDLLKKYREMYDREKKSGSQDHSGSDKILDDIMKNVAEQVPVTWADKFNTWRYFSMLGNPRTHIRNLAGNTFFMPLILAKNMVAAVGEGLAAPAAKLFGKNMQRTKTLGGVLSFGGEYMRYGKKDAQKIEAMLRGEKKYSELQKIMQSRKIFTSKFSAFFKVNEKVNKNTKRLEQEDWIFLKHNYARALTMYMKANKLSPDTITEKQLETARLYAVREAQKASFRDESALAKVIQRTEKSHKALGFAVGALMPFKQTPINVLKRGIEYSPVGAITTVGKGIKGVYEGKFSATEFIDGLGATLSGTGLCYLGVYLASQGLLFGPGDDDDENRMNILNGIQNYSLKIGNGTYTIDWASPAAMSLFVGCEIWNSLADKEERTFADIADALMSITEPVFEMSMLEGLMSVFRAGVYATRDSEAATEALTSIIPNYFSQFVPAILGQIARTIDPVRRKTYVDKNKNVPEWLQLFGQQMAKKFPGTSFLLDPYVNAKGETELNAEGNIFSRAMQNFFSPGYYKSIKSNEVDSEISRLYEKFGSDANEVIPKTVGRKIGDVNLSSEQYTKYQQVTGQAYYSKLKEIISSDYYQNLSDTDKVRLLKKAREYAVEKGKEETLSDYHSSEGWLMKAFETDGLYRHVLNEVKEGKFSEEDLVGDAREFYEEEKDKIFSDILAEYNPDKLDYELADKFYEDLYDLSEKIALEANSDGQYVIEDTWINNAKELEAEERAQYIYGRAILTQYDDQDKANDALQNDSFISDKVRGYLLEKSSFSSDNPSKLYSNHVARHSNEISFEEYTKLWEKWEAAEKYKVGNKTVDKKDQILPEINKLKISNAAKSRIYDSFGWGNSERALKDVPWGYVPDSQSPDVLSKRVGNTIANIKSSAYNNDADYGQCVWYARGRTKELLGKNIPAMGNANQMFANAKKNSKIEAKPENLKANMLVTYNKGTSTAGQYAGHVIYIEAVDGDTVYYTEGGSLKISGILRKATKDQIMKGITNDRKLGSDIIGFIDVTKY